MLWCMQRTNIYLDEGQIDALDRRAGEQGVSRAELIRRVLDDWLAGAGPDLDADLDAIEASAGALADLEVQDRGPDGRARHLDRMWALRP